MLKKPAIMYFGLSFAIIFLAVGALMFLYLTSAKNSD
jgi:hypothetical protein